MMRQKKHEKKARLEKQGWRVGSVGLLLKSLFALDAKREQITQILVS